MKAPPSYRTWCPYQPPPQRPVQCHIQHFTRAPPAMRGTPRWAPSRCCSTTWPPCWPALRRATMSASATCRQFIPSFIQTGLMMMTESFGMSPPLVTLPPSTPTTPTTARPPTTAPPSPRISSHSGSQTRPNIFRTQTQEILGVPRPQLMMAM